MEPTIPGFNEAGGFLPRKRRRKTQAGTTTPVASMRPEDFSPGNTESFYVFGSKDDEASMRPEDFSPGNAQPGADRPLRAGQASMRPEDFSPGNQRKRPASRRRRISLLQ